MPRGSKFVKGGCTEELPFLSLVFAATPVAMPARAVGMEALVVQVFVVGLSISSISVKLALQSLVKTTSHDITPFHQSLPQRRQPDSSV